MRGVGQFLYIGDACLESRQLTGNMIVAYKIPACTEKVTWEQIGYFPQYRSQGEPNEAIRQMVKTKK